MCGKMCGKIEKLSDWNNKNGVVVDMDPMIMIVMTKRQKTKRQKGKKKKTKRQQGKKAKIQKEKKKDREPKQPPCPPQELDRWGHRPLKF